MTDTRTPGQIAYEAWCDAHGDPTWFSPWEVLLRYRQQPWDAAAQAVLALKEEERHG